MKSFVIVCSNGSEALEVLTDFMIEENGGSDERTS